MHLFVRRRRRRRQQRCFRATFLSDRISHGDHCQSYHQEHQFIVSVRFISIVLRVSNSDNREKNDDCDH